MTTWTADGYAGSGRIWTADGWPTAAVPWTADGFVVDEATVPATPEQPTGGWLFQNDYDSELARRRALRRKLKKLEEEDEQIQDAVTREIAQILRQQQAKDERRDELKRLGELAKRSADLEAARLYGERVATAYARALSKGTYSALEALDRELARAREEEEALSLMFMLLH